jgi:hypothetical protein
MSQHCTQYEIINQSNDVYTRLITNNYISCNIMGNSLSFPKSQCFDNLPYNLLGISANSTLYDTHNRRNFPYKLQLVKRPYYIYKQYYSPVYSANVQYILTHNHGAWIRKVTVFNPLTAPLKSHSRCSIL